MHCQVDISASTVVATGPRLSIYWLPVSWFLSNSNSSRVQNESAAAAACLDESQLLFLQQQLSHLRPCCRCSCCIIQQQFVCSEATLSFSEEILSCRASKLSCSNISPAEILQNNSKKFSHSSALHGTCRFWAQNGGRALLWSDKRRRGGIQSRSNLRCKLVFCHCLVFLQSVRTVPFKLQKLSETLYLEDKEEALNKFRQLLDYLPPKMVRL